MQISNWSTVDLNFGIRGSQESFSREALVSFRYLNCNMEELEENCLECNRYRQRCNYDNSLFVHDGKQYK